MTLHLPIVETALVPITNTTPEVVLVNSPTTQAQSFLKVMVPLPPVQPSRNRKSTQLFDFVYSSYSGSFAVFIVFINRLHEPSSNREVVCDPLWLNVIAEELTALH